MHRGTRKTGLTANAARLAGASLFLGACLASGAGCDTTAKFSIDEVRPDPARPFLLVGATPLKELTGSTSTPACTTGDTVNGFRVDFVLKSTEHEGALEGNRDLQIRDGDRISGIRIGIGSNINPSDFKFGGGNNQLDRVSPYSNVGQSFQLANATPELLTFTSRNARRSDPVAVAVIVDHSGSMLGRVDPDRFFEVKSNAVTAIPITEAQSDPSRARYDKLSSNLLWLLNDNDRAIAWFINETGVNLACAAPELAGSLAASSLAEKERFCFRADQRQWISAPPQVNPQPDAFDILGSGSGLVAGVEGRELGRTPLWTAVDHAYTFLQNEAPADMAKHIIVLTDSPDTCNPDSSHFVPDEACNTGDPSVLPASWSAFRSRLLQEADASKRIPISVIQLQSLGYPDPDPAQQEASCLTGGTYQWINGNAFAKSTAEFPQAIEERVLRLRYTLGGVWSLHVSAAGSMAQMAAAVQHILVEGSLALTPSAGLPFPNNAVVNFRQGTPDDTRLILRRTCSAEADCNGDDLDCVDSCVPDGSVCALNDDRAAWLNTEACCCGAAGAVEQCTAFRAPCCNADNSNNLVCEP